MKCVSCDICVCHLGLFVLFPRVFLSSRVTGTCPVTTDLMTVCELMYVTSTTTTTWYLVPGSWYLVPGTSHDTWYGMFERKHSAARHSIAPQGKARHRTHRTAVRCATELGLHFFVIQRCSTYEPGVLIVGYLPGTWYDTSNNTWQGMSRRC